MPSIVHLSMLMPGGSLMHGVMQRIACEMSAIPDVMR